MRTLPFIVSFLFIYHLYAVQSYADDLPNMIGGSSGLVFTSDYLAAKKLISVYQEDLVGQSAQGLSADNFWDLTKNAGPLRWPIYVVFLVGMFLVFFKLFVLLTDKRESKEIEGMNFRTMSVQQIIRAISGQKESMISRLHSSMLNVFQSHQVHADLHEEIANYVRFQQDHFDTFRRRIDFLSDTAGALGLLGTVWGIFSVFSQGLLDDQVILTGMGVALITTLLGLIASIILNLSATEIFSFFNKRLDRIAEKSDELRFRLMELAAEPEETEPEETESEETESEHFMPEMDGMGERDRSFLGSGRSATSDDSSDESNEELNHIERQADKKSIAQVEAVFKDRFSNSLFGDSAPSPVRKPLVKTKVEDSVEPRDLSFINAIHEGTVGKKVRNLCLLLLDNNGDPISEREIEIRVEEGGSLLNDEEQVVTVVTDENGEARFDLKIAEKAGMQVLYAHVPGSEAPRTRCRLSYQAKAGVPRKLKQFGNNQGGAAGEFLAKALKVQVLDEFENPIPDWTVIYSVELGGGTFKNGETQVTTKTNSNGEGIAQLRVGEEPGFNTVKATVEGVVKELKFQAMSMA